MTPEDIIIRITPQDAKKVRKLYNKYKTGQITNKFEEVKTTAGRFAVNEEGWIFPYTKGNHRFIPHTCIVYFDITDKYVEIIAV